MPDGAWVLQATFHAEADAAGAWSNMPSAETFLFNSHRHIINLDLEGMTIIRLKVNKQATAGAAAAKLILRYSPTFSTSVGAYSDIGTSEVSVAINTTNTFLDSGWVEIVGPAKREVFLAVVGSGGDGALDPAFGSIAVGVQ